MTPAPQLALIDPQPGERTSVEEDRVEDKASARGGPVGQVATDETNRLISSRKVEDTPVFSRQGERLGTVDSFMVDKFTGQVAYAVMSFGGFLGVGERFHPLPWKVLTYDTSAGGYLVDLDRDKLRAAPSFGPAEPPNWTDPAYGRQVHDYYDVPLYWGAH